MAKSFALFFPMCGTKIGFLKKKKERNQVEKDSQPQKPKSFFFQL